MSKIQAQEVTIRHPEMHPGQVAIWNEADYVMREHGNGEFYLCGHRGWWKSSFVLKRVLMYIQRGYPVGWYAPTMRPITNIWNDLFKKALGEEDFERCINKTDKILSLPGMGSIHFYSLDEPSNAAGPTFPFIVGDEWGSLQDGVHESVVMKILNKGRASYDHSEGWFVGTPNRDGNPRNDFYKYLTNTKRRDLLPNYRSWVIGVPGQVNEQGEYCPKDSPLANPDAMYSYETMKMDYELAERKVGWRIEYLCEFLSDDGAQFSGIERACVLPFTQHAGGVCTLEGYTPSRQGWYQTGVDIGIKNDFSVLSVLDRATMKQVYHRRFLPGEWEPLYQAILEVARIYPGRIYVDCTGMGQSVPDTLAKRGLTVEGISYNATVKPQLMDHLSSLIESAQVKLFHHHDIENELTLMERKARSTGGYTISGPSSGHDDIPNSLALMVRNVHPIAALTSSTWNFPTDVLSNGKSPFATIGNW